VSGNEAGAQARKRAARAAVDGKCSLGRGDT